MNNGETIPDFMSTFCKLYHRIPKIVKPYEPNVVVSYATTFEANFSLHLKERKSIYLDPMVNHTEYLESSMRSSMIQLKIVQGPP